MTRVLAMICVTLGLLPALAAAPARADDMSFCDMAGPEHWAAVSAAIAGFWEMEDLGGTMTAAGRTQPLPASHFRDTFTMFTSDDELSAVSDGGESIGFHPADEPAWVMGGEDGAAQPVSPDDAALLQGCRDQTQMPRIIGGGTVMAEGQPLELLYRLVVLSPAQMYGVKQATGTRDGIPFVIRRAVMFHRLG